MFTLYVIGTGLTFAMLAGIMRGLFPRSWPLWKCALGALCWPVVVPYVIVRKLFEVVL